MRDLRNEKFERMRLAAEEKQLVKIRNHPHIPSDFDWKDYLFLNPFLAKKNIDTELSALRHWVKFGRKEGLKYKIDDEEVNNININIFYPEKINKKDEEPAEKLEVKFVEEIGIAEVVDETPKKKNRKVIYTCIAGAYDTIKKITNRDDSWDYVCFTNIDNDDTKTGWEIRKIPEILEPLDQTRQARAIKILPHLFLPEYDTWIWIDGTIEILDSPSKFMIKHIEPTDVFVTCKHPDRICVYQERDACVKFGKDSVARLDKQVVQYRKEGYPENWGMIQSGLIYRKNMPEVVRFCNLWWEQVLTFSKRDQMSFNYVLWKNPIPVRLIKPSIICSEFFWLWTHNARDSRRASLRKTYDDIQNFINGNPI